jgi:hypothetical protein
MLRAGRGPKIRHVEYGLNCIHFKLLKTHPCHARSATSNAACIRLTGARQLIQGLTSCLTFSVDAGFAESGRPRLLIFSSCNRSAARVKLIGPVGFPGKVVVTENNGILEFRLIFQVCRYSIHKRWTRRALALACAPPVS